MKRPADGTRARRDWFTARRPSLFRSSDRGDRAMTRSARAIPDAGQSRRSRVAGSVPDPDAVLGDSGIAACGLLGEAEGDSARVRSQCRNSGVSFGPFVKTNLFAPLRARARPSSTPERGTTARCQPERDRLPPCLPGERDSPPRQAGGSSRPSPSSSSPRTTARTGRAATPRASLPLRGRSAASSVTSICLACSTTLVWSAARFRCSRRRQRE